jgi:2-polyprenyl-6-methoxyphenol hydroxylase-like FAD-dependent oxidoreductase
MITSRDYDDVVVIGAGPAGLAAAAELAHHGVRCTVIEPRPAVQYERPRAKTTSARTMEFFRRWGIADDVRQAAALPTTWSRRAVFCDTANGSVITDFDDIFGLSAAEQGLAAESGQQIAQPVVEEVLRAHLLRRGLTDLRLGESFVDLLEHPDHVLVTVRGADGEMRTIRTKYLLGCDGARSAVRQCIGAALEGTSAPRANLNVVLRAPALRPATGPALHYWALGPETPGIIGPLDREGLWWASLGATGDLSDEREITRLVTELIGGETAVPLEILATDPWTPRMMIADRFGTDRVFLVGESAHVNPPLGGHGFNTSVGDAVNIGWKLAAVLQGWAAPDILTSYETERRGVARATIDSAARNLAATGPNLRATAESLQETKREEFHSLGLVLGYSYRASAAPDVVSYAPSTAIGSRLPHRWLRPGRAVFDELGRGMSLVHSDEITPEELELWRRRYRATSIPLSTVGIPPEFVDPLEPLLLVRPDQHIGWRGVDLAAADPQATLRMITEKVPL